MNFQFFLLDSWVSTICSHPFLCFSFYFQFFLLDSLVSEGYAYSQHRSRGPFNSSYWIPRPQSWRTPSAPPLFFQFFLLDSEAVAIASPPAKVLVAFNSSYWIPREAVHRRHRGHGVAFQFFLLDSRVLHIRRDTEGSRQSFQFFLLDSELDL